MSEITTEEIRRLSEPRLVDEMGSTAVDAPQAEGDIEEVQY